MTLTIAICLLIPLLGTTLGSCTVFFLKKEINANVQKVLMGFASGVMLAASIWSLLQPAINTYKKGDFKMWLVPAVGFILGIVFSLLLDYLVPHTHLTSGEDGIKTPKISKTSKMLFAVTLHNIPEGLACGVVIAGAISGTFNPQAMIILSVGIAIQNFPEGAIVSMPLKEQGISKLRAFTYGFISGAVEPIASLLAILVTAFVSAILPYTLAFAAAVMIFVVVEDLIPEMSSGEHSNIATIGLAVGFVLMMILDIALG